MKTLESGGKDPEENRPHIGPGKKITSVYMDKAFHVRVKARAKSLGISMAKYFVALAEKHMREGGPLVLTPQAVTSPQDSGGTSDGSQALLETIKKHPSRKGRHKNVSTKVSTE
jgi:hypothetical protein